MVKLGAFKIVFSVASLLCVINGLPTETGKDHENNQQGGGGGQNGGNSTQGPPGVNDIPEGFQGSNGQNDTKRYIYQDDMIIKKDQNRAGIVNLVWPNGVIPWNYHYTISPKQRLEIAQAMNDISAATCIKFRPSKYEDTYSLMYQSDPSSQGCSSYVGWQNKKNQPIQLAQICSQGNIVHEIIHALGFCHEHTRNDREDYIRVNYENIQPNYEGNFKRDADYGYDAEYYDVPYNYDSIMHYGKAFFSKNQKPTIEIVTKADRIEPLGSGNNIGQRDAMSYGDIQMIKNKYKCPESTGTPSNVEHDFTTAMSSPTPPTTATTPVPEDSNSTTTKPGSNPMCQYNPMMC